MRKKEIFYKLAREDGWDFHTGNTINYRENIGKVVKCPNPNPELGVCSNGVIHASKNPNDCFIGAGIPCSAYKVKGTPTCGNEQKNGFTELEVLEEIEDLNTLFGWRYSEAKTPINPFMLPKKEVDKQDLKDLQAWSSVWNLVRASIWDFDRDPGRTSVWDAIGSSIRASVRDSVWDSAWDSVRASVGTSIMDSVASVEYSVTNSVWDSVKAYIGSLFPNIKKWKYVEHKEGEYPFQSIVNLWKRGLVASYDTKKWRLHSGKDAEIVWKGTIEDLEKEVEEN